MCACVCDQVTERILQRVVNSTSDWHTRLLLAQSLSKQRKVEAAVAEYKSVRPTLRPWLSWCGKGVEWVGSCVTCVPAGFAGD